MLDDVTFFENTVTFDALTPLPLQDTAITIGNFDGVHLGHQAIISKMVQDATPLHRPVLVVTFYPNPVDFFNPQRKSFYLSTPWEKQTHLCALGVHDVITFKFDRDFANLSAQTFLDALKNKLGLRELIVGHDFALGKNRAGTLPVVEEIGQQLSFTVKVIDQIRLGNEDISSTQIRNKLNEGDVAGAAQLLGRWYAVSGKVAHGSDRGARIGLPTANIIHWPKKKLPAVGVYATYTILKNKIYQGITNVGHRPTFEQQDLPNVETHLFDFNEEIYGENLEIQFVQKIRDEHKFSGVPDFLAQIARDKASARRIFNHV